MRFNSTVNVGSAKALKRLVFTFTAKEGTIDIGVPVRAQSQARRGRKPVPLWRLVIWGEWGVAKKGGGRQAARPVITPLYDNQGPAWQRSLLSGVLMAARRGDPLSKATTRLGKKIVEDIRLAYATYRRIHNTPATIANKGFDDPLIETGDLSRGWKAAWRPTKTEKISMTALNRAFAQLTKSGGR